MKECKSCNIFKPLNEFYEIKIRGKIYYHSECKCCKNKTNKVVLTKQEKIDKHNEILKGVWNEIRS